MISLTDRLLLFEGVQSGVTYTFTSATSSTSSSYTVTLTSQAGQTIPLTMNGVSQGNMVESPAGTYSKAVTLNQLTNTFSVASTTFNVLSYAYWQENNASVWVGGLPESAWASSATFFTGGNSSGRTFINPAMGIHCDTVITDVRLNALSTSSQAGAKLKHIRKNVSSGWDLIAEETFTLGVTSQTVTLATPFNMLKGDLIGLFLPNSAARIDTQNYYTIANGTQDALYESGDKTGTGFTFALNIPNEMEITPLGKPASLGIAGDSIPSGASNWQTPFDTYTTARSVVPSGNEAFDLGYQINQLKSGLRWINFSRGSQTYAYAASTAFLNLVAAEIHTALLMFGINDVATGRTWANIEADLNTIKTAFDASNIERLWIAEILPWTNGNDTQAATVRTFNSNLAAWCNANGATLIETHDAMGQIRVSTGELDDLKTAFDSDGVHLTDTGMAELASLVEAYL